MKVKGLKLSVICLLLLCLLTACMAGKGPATESGKMTTTGSSKVEATTKTEVAAETAPMEEPATRSFTDSVGRTLELPARIERFAPSGPLAQIVLYTAAPDGLIGTAKAFSDAAKGLIPDRYFELPVFGQFYGKNSNLNLEAVLAAGPQLVIDIGEAKKSVREDMDKLQEQIGIPCVFIEAHLTDLPQTYQKLGELLGDELRCQQLSEAAAAILQRAEKARSACPEAQWKKLYWAMGDDGLFTNAKESFQSEVLKLLPVQNVADVEAFSKGAASEVSLEQLLLWQPDMLLIDRPELFENMRKDERWAAIPAWNEEQFLLVPRIPYGFLSDPPSVNRLLGLDWLGSKLYPEFYEQATEDYVKEFYKLFYQIELSDEQLKAVLEGR